MSRIGRLPIPVPAGVDVSIDGQDVTVKGPRGELALSVVEPIRVAPGDDGTTLLSYDADAIVGGMIGGVGQRLLTGVAKRTAGEFFTAVVWAALGVWALSCWRAWASSSRWRGASKP